MPGQQFSCNNKTRDTLVSAAYLGASDGRCVAMEHLLHGTRRELQKMGRLVGEKDLVIG